MKSFPLEWAQILIGLGLLFPVQYGIDSREREKPDVVRTLPPERVLPLLALGHRESMADILEVRTVNFLMDHMKTFTRMDRNHLWKLYGGIRELDPNDPWACWRAAVYLSSVADRPDSAIDMLKRGLGLPYGPDKKKPRHAVHPNHPDRWRLYYEWGMIHVMMYASRAKTDEERLSHTRTAGRLLLEASQQPNIPPAMKGDLEQAGLTFKQKGLSQLEAIKVACQLWRDKVKQGDRLTQAHAKQRLKESLCDLRRQELQDRLDSLQSRGREPTRLEELQISLDDPLEFGFLLREGEVIAPALEAARLERNLRHRLRNFKRSHPDKQPTAADLGSEDLPDYLQLDLSTDSPRVMAISPGP